MDECFHKESYENRRFKYFCWNALVLLLTFGIVQSGRYNTNEIKY